MSLPEECADVQLVALALIALALLPSACAAKGSPVVAAVSQDVISPEWRPEPRLRHCTKTGALIHLADGRTLVELQCPLKDYRHPDESFVAADLATGKRVR